MRVACRSLGDVAPNNFVPHSANKRGVNTEISGNGGVRPGVNPYGYNSLVSEFCQGTCYALAYRFMPNFVAIIFGMGCPSKVVKAAIHRVAIAVRAFHSFRACAFKCFQHKPMHKGWPVFPAIFFKVYDGVAPSINRGLCRKYFFWKRQVPIRVHRNVRVPFYTPQIGNGVPTTKPDGKNPNFIFHIRLIYWAKTQYIQIVNVCLVCGENKCL